MSKIHCFTWNNPFWYYIRIHLEIQKISYYHQINIVSRETMDYKKNELKAHEKTVQANKERKYNKKSIFWLMSIFMNVADRD